MCKNRVNQHIIVLNLCSISISKVLVTTQSMTFTESKFNAKNDNIVKSTTYIRYFFSKIIECLEKSNIQMMYISIQNIQIKV